MESAPRKGTTGTRGRRGSRGERSLGRPCRLPDESRLGERRTPCTSCTPGTPGTPGAIVSFKARYGNFIGGEFVAPAGGLYFTNTSPVNGQPIAEFPRSDAADIDKALDAAHAAADAWGRRRAAEVCARGILQ